MASRYICSECSFSGSSSAVASHISFMKINDNGHVGARALSESAARGMQAENEWNSTNAQQAAQNQIDDGALRMQQAQNEWNSTSAVQNAVQNQIDDGALRMQQAQNEWEQTHPPSSGGGSGSGGTATPPPRFTFNGEYPYNVAQSMGGNITDTLNDSIKLYNHIYDTDFALNSSGQIRSNGGSGSYMTPDDNATLNNVIRTGYSTNYEIPESPASTPVDTPPSVTPPEAPAATEPEVAVGESPVTPTTSASLPEAEVEADGEPSESAGGPGSESESNNESSSLPTEEQSRNKDDEKKNDHRFWEGGSIETAIENHFGPELANGGTVPVHEVVEGFDELGINVPGHIAADGKLTEREIATIIRNNVREGNLEFSANGGLRRSENADEALANNPTDRDTDKKNQSGGNVDSDESKEQAMASAVNAQQKELAQAQKHNNRMKRIMDQRAAWSKSSGTGNPNDSLAAPHIAPASSSNAQNSTGLPTQL